MKRYLIVEYGAHWEIVNDYDTLADALKRLRELETVYKNTKNFQYYLFVRVSDESL